MLEEDEIKQVDKSNMITYYSSWNKLFREALKIDITLPPLREYDNLIFGGMGGSIIAGELIADWIYPKAKIPSLIVKDYHLPFFADSNSLIIVASVSGETEESLSLLREAKERGCGCVALSSGGRMESYSKEQNLPHIKIERGLAPRAALPFLLVPEILLLKDLKILDKELIKEFFDSFIFLDDLSNSFKPSSPFEENLAKKVAFSYYNKRIVTYASSEIKGLAFRFKASVNENAKMSMQLELLPELCHNEIESWEGDKDRLALLIKREEEREEIRKRFHIIKEMLQAKGVEILEVNLKGKGFQAILYGLYLLDFSSLYAAILRGIDPLPTKNIDKFKELLATQR
ncbi:MAG: SIS domain-containing protein [Nitrososphaerales archaeon]